jgi:hypothetical protein
VKLQFKHQLQKRQALKLQQRLQVQLRVPLLVHDQADHVLVTIHLLQHHVHHVLAIIHFHPAALDLAPVAALLAHLVQRALAQVDRVAQAEIAQAVLVDLVQVDLAAQVVQAVLVDKVEQVALVAIVPVALVDLVQQEPVVVSLVPVHQVELQVEHLAADQVDVRTQLVVVATQQAHSENPEAGLLRVASQSALSAKSSTT